MKKFDINDSRKKITNREIDSLEIMMNIKFPDDYRSFLMAYNGGKPEPNLIPIKDNPSDTHAILLRLYCVAEEDELGIIHDNQLVKGRLPYGFIAIGEDPGGNLICIDVTPENAGKIYFWDHEEETPEDETPDNKNVYFVADSFQEMMSKLSE